MTADDLSMRLYLNVPHSEREAAKRHGAWWDAILKRWWIDRRNLALNPGVYRWLDRGSVAYRQAKEAFDFVTRARTSARRKAGR